MEYTERLSGGEIMYINTKGDHVTKEYIDLRYALSKFLEQYGYGKPSDKETEDLIEEFLPRIADTWEIMAMED